MIWHEAEDPVVIVMLTQITEGGRDKCFQYFPDSAEDDTIVVNEEDEFEDGFKATVKLEHVYEDYEARSVIRQLSLTVNETSKTVWHFLFAGWPDFSIPEGADRAALIELIQLSEEANSTAGNPRIVHCSAGVGRSGTFIALDYLLSLMDEGLFEKEAERTEADIVFDTVNTLREQRMSMVQSDAQLSFIYEVIKERWLVKRQSSVSERSSTHQNGSTQAQADAQDESFSQPTMILDRGSQQLPPDSS